MMTNTALKTLGAQGLRQYQGLQADAVSVVTERFYATHGSACQGFGPRGRDACREDLAFHLEFLRPVLEFGLLQPMVDYLCWLAGVLAARGIATEHLTLSLDWLAMYFADHMEAADGAVVSAALQAARTKFLAAGATPAASPKSPAPWPAASVFESLLLVGNQREAMAMVSGCIDQGRSLIEIEMHLIQPALYGIGEKWQANQVSVAQEHMATAIAQSAMSLGLLRSSPSAPLGRRALLACAEGNSHSLGLQMVTDAFQLAGWDVQFLGANVPSPALVRQVAEWKPDLVCLSVAFAQHLRAVKVVIAQLDERLGAIRPGIMIGGLAINRFNQLAEMAGADAFCTDAQAAVAAANQVIRARKAAP